MQIAATSRNLQGTGASRRLRISGNTPGILFGAGQDAQKIEIDHNTLFHALKKEAFHTSILDLDLDGQVVKAVLRDVQYHPFKPAILHVDFQRVDENTKVESKVALRYEGAEQSPAVTVENGTVTPLITEVSVLATPAKTPEFITVDLSKLTSKIIPGLQTVKAPAGVKIIARGSNKNPVLVAVKLPEAAVAAPVATAAPAKKGKK
ncbi:50S ribosomal protein L25/general stress protein Ctc [Comamonas aquatica]|jgi:large subunit ribosomal protein L25|uniref:Large ribosomal subunit protein bL25 n=2 Tax=Comamonas aquatica TaxID=225991 RepID=A0A014MSI7_9BURK|nr:50S ribosomal protein L25/general stress protein Ctc [Comamonas aquatica]ANY63329.1 50S ribosomal protein L25/general stress protein Ctc [Comamonas aquatica]EXU81059.1 50S ribosomal protein L25 [Comamonas aquatica DA1877]MDE1554480.1 50S ribosomal protein L25/general stress protein Ctc [Comamonas aquatica]MDH0200395.1 50S ribosomal protein L25/general stress protein Ctc [Comamonas aquatica]MDH0361736.1 50S ribosomal protein L25/general stress protein Ctc [Comamonas aquatica]